MGTSNLSIQIGKNIAHQRKMLGFTQARLAEMVDLENETISRIESGKHNVSIKSLERFSNALHITVADLVSTNTAQEQKQTKTIAFMLENLSDSNKDAVMKILAEICAISHKK